MSSFDGNKGSSNRRRRRNKRPRNTKKQPTSGAPNSETETDGGLAPPKGGKTAPSNKTRDASSQGDTDPASTGRESDDREKTPTAGQKTLAAAEKSGTKANGTAKLESGSAPQVNGVAQSSTSTEDCVRAGKSQGTSVRAAGAGKTVANEH